MFPVVDNKNRPVRFGSEVARGGEGIVYEVADDPAVLAKIYFKPADTIKTNKLLAMAQAATPEVVKFAAWPSATLHRNRDVVGILMRRAPSRSKPIHELYTPKSRIREFPSANWQFLVNVAANVIRGFAVIHQSGHIIGDVNHGNILVAPNGTTAFIDCDSFQISANGKIFLCEVGVSTYTPPELQNKSFNQIVRTQTHDCFGLAILLFHLLFMGRHPFAGRYSGPGYMPIERAIGECRFAFGRLASNMLMSPPPDSLLLNQVSASLADAFERAFSREAARGCNRPSALEWLTIIEQFQKELTRCKAHKAHLYYHRLAFCPWCPIETHGVTHGVILFIDIDIDVPAGLDIESLWRRINNLASLGDLPPIPTVTNRNLAVPAFSEVRSQGRTRRVRIGIGVFIVIMTICCVVWLNVNGLVALPIIAVAIGIAYRLPLSLQQKRAAAIKHCRECQQRYEQLQARYSSECSESSFKAKVREVSTLREQCSQLQALRRQKIQELEKNKFQHQLHDFLDRINLSDAHIPKIGPGRKAMLTSYGIDTAADVSYGAVTQVPGIGPTYATNLLAWRQAQESKFRFDPSKAIAKPEIEKIDHEIQTRRAQLEDGIMRGVQDAVAAHARILALRKSYQEQLENALLSFAQAEANMKIS
jgi:DNA-binding helix-hairpin-helix protein with protein kinase domain